MTPATRAGQHLQQHVLASGPVNYIDDALVVFRSIEVEGAARAIDPGAWGAPTDLDDYKRLADRKTAAYAAVRALVKHLTSEETP